MTHQIFGRFARTALAVAMLAGAQFAAAEVVVGTKIKLEDGTGNGNGGAFNGFVVAGGGTGLSGNAAYGNTFQSFCVEYNEHIALSYWNDSHTKYTEYDYYVAGVTNHTVNAPGAYGTYSGPETGHTSTQDPISSQTAWLFTQFYNTGLSDTSLWGTGSQATKNTALQQAIWSLENEPSGSLSTLASSYKAMANTAVSSHLWSGLGNVRVLNLFANYDAQTHQYSGYRQDQLYMVSAVPETETYAMMLAGLGLMGTIARRRKSKTI